MVLWSDPYIFTSSHLLIALFNTLLTANKSSKIKKMFRRAGPKSSIRNHQSEIINPKSSIRNPPFLTAPPFQSQPVT